MDKMDDTITVQKFYDSLLTEKENLETNIEKNHSEIHSLKDELRNLVSNDDELEFFSPNTKDEKQKHMKALTEKIQILTKINESYEEKLKLLVHNIHFFEKQQNRKMDDSLSQVIIHLNEMDRERIARELHDTTIQNMVCLIHKMELASKFIDRDPIRTKLEITSAIQNIRESIDDLRGLVYDLRPMTFDDLGFEVLLKQYLDELNHLYPNEITYEIKADFSNINEDYLITIYRIIKECCINSIKHSGGGHLHVSVTEKDEWIHIVVKDDGKGFTSTDKIGKHHYGTQILNDRVLLLNGKINVQTAPGKGYLTDILLNKSELKV